MQVGDTVEQMTQHTEEPGDRPAPLAGVRIVDFTLFLSGPFGTQILGDMGAEVIKCEPAGGDQTRYLPPNFVENESAYYLSVNRNKRSVRIDYKTPEGLALIERLVADADVFIENHRPGSLAKYGISPERFAEINPRLIWCSISGFGQDGPYADRPAYDMIVQAMSGGMSLTGERGGRPVRSGVPLGDLAAGMYGATAVLGALHARHTTGKGSVIDISMLDCQVAMLTYQAAYYLHSGTVPGAQGRSHESIPSYRAFTAGDDIDFVVCANTDRMWVSLCDVAGCGEWGRQARFADRKTRYANRREIAEVLEAAFLENTAAEWVASLQAAAVPAAMVNTLDLALNDAQVRHRGMVIELTSKQGNRVRLAGNPIKMTGIDPSCHRFPPHLGEDSTFVLKQHLKLSDAEIERLAQAGVIQH